MSSLVKGTKKLSIQTRGFTLGLEQAKFGLQILANVANGAVNVPGLMAVAQVAIQIIEIVQTVRSNKEDCLILADRIVQLMTAMIDTLKDRKEEDIEASLKDDVARFHGDLERILSILRQISSRSKFSRVLKHKEDSGEIQKCKEMLDHSVKTFQVYTQIALRLRMGTVQDSIDSIVHQFQDLNNPLKSKLSETIQLSSTAPPAPSIFFGRDDFIAHAVAHIKVVSPSRIAILGAGGMGKTSTALTILHHQDIQSMFHGKCYFVPCDAAITPSLLVASILQVVPVSQGFERDPLTVLHHALASSSPVLLVLDNFETPWDESGSQQDIESILQRLSAIKHVSIIITMRGTISPSGVQWTESKELSPLSLSAARQAFNAVNQTVETSGDLDMLLQQLDCIPLAVMLMSQLAKGQKIGILLKRWNKEQTSMLQTERGKAGRLTSIDVSISISLNQVKDDAEAVQLLALVSHLPDGLIKWEENLNSIASKFKFAERVAAALLKYSLVYTDLNGSLKAVSLIRSYTQRNYPLEEQHMKTLEKYYFDLITKYGNVRYGSGFHEAYTQLMPELGNISSVIKYALQHHPYTEVALAVYDISPFLYYAQPSADLLKEVLSHLQELKLEHMEGGCHYLMGAVFSAEGKLDSAMAEFQLAQAMFIQLGGHIGQAGATKALHGIGRIHFSQKRYEEAQQALQAALEQYLTIGDQIRAATCLQNLGEIHRVQDNLSKAFEILQTAHLQFLQAKYQHGATQCLHSLGMIHIANKAYDQAKSTLKQAKQEFSHMGDEISQAQCLESMGRLFYDQDAFVDAIMKIKEALLIYQRKGHKQSEARCLQKLGEYQCLTKEFEEANIMLSQAYDQFMKLENYQCAAQCLQSQADVLQFQMQKYEVVIQKIEEALVLFDKIEDQNGKAECLLSLANLIIVDWTYNPDSSEPMDWSQMYAVKTRRFEIAKQKLHEAEELFAKNATNNIGVAFCQQSLAQILFQETRWKEYSPQKIEVLETVLVKLRLVQAEFSKRGNKKEECSCLKSIAYTLFYQNKEDEAKIVWKEACKLHREFGEKGTNLRWEDSSISVNHNERFLSLRSLRYSAEYYGTSSYIAVDDEWSDE